MAHTQRLYDHKCIGKHTKHRILASYKTNQSDTCTHLCSAKQKSDAMRKSFVKHNYKVSVSNKQQHHIQLKMFKEHTITQRESTVKSTDNQQTNSNTIARPLHSSKCRPAIFVSDHFFILWRMERHK
eukprot:822834_1